MLTELCREAPSPALYAGTFGLFCLCQGSYRLNLLDSWPAHLSLVGWDCQSRHHYPLFNPEIMVFNTYSGFSHLGTRMAGFLTPRCSIGHLLVRCGQSHHRATRSVSRVTILVPDSDLPSVIWHSLARDTIGYS